jgi:hypothetical protein
VDGGAAAGGAVSACFETCYMLRVAIDGSICGGTGQRSTRWHAPRGLCQVNETITDAPATAVAPTKMQYNGVST